VGGQIVAISVPAPSDRFRANEKRIVAALHAASETAPWTISS
jgi:DNA-binding IclR family transcriptional regulator